MDSDNSVFQVGSNVFELIEFTMQPNRAGVVHSDASLETQPAPGILSTKAMSFGVNVAKVKEIIRFPTIQPCLTSCPEVLGVFNLRGHPVPVIHLALALSIPQPFDITTCQVIVTEFSGRIAGFIVGSAKRIRRENWSHVLPPSSEAFSSITGMIRTESQEFIYIVDFERILMDIEGRTGMGARHLNGPSVAFPMPTPSHLSSKPELEASESNKSDFLQFSSKYTVFIVDDSNTARKALQQMLTHPNLNVMEYTNGEEFWFALQQESMARYLTPGQSCVVSDVEMPIMDGYTLCKNIKSSPQLRHLPVILHSSLSGDVAKSRASDAGAVSYVTKFNRSGLLEAVRNSFTAQPILAVG
jgi:two-component system chemotaxis response regulator CheV